MISRFLYLFLFIFLSSSFANNEKNILILHSYHQTYKWTDDINKGISSVINNSNNNYKIFVEYMDTKRFVDDTHYEHLYNSYKKKYKKTKFDVIISSDDNAFNFLKKYNKTLFNSVPVLFSGVNYLKKEDLIGFDNFKGVSEQADIIENFKLIKDLFPNTKNIYTIFDNTTTGKRVEKEVKDVIKQLEKDGINYKFLTNTSFNELRDNVKALPKDSVILLSVFFRDSNNKFYEYYEVSQMISKESNIPLFGLWDFNLNNGIIGGYLTSGFFQGKNVAQLAKKVLNGTHIQNIDLVYEGANNYMFDFNKLQQFDIDKQKLPIGSYIENQPISFYEEYKREILTVLLILFLLLISVLLLLIILYQKSKNQLLMKKELKFQQTLMDTVDTPVYYKNKDGIYIGCNKAFVSYMSFKKGDLRRSDIIGKTVYDLLPKDLAKLHTKKDNELFKNRFTQTYEGLHRYIEEETKNLLFFKNVYYDENEKVAGLVGTIFDITDLKRTTEELDKLNKNLEKKVKQKSKELVKSEVLNSLGSIVAGVAHEINTPIGIGITASSHLDEMSKKIYSSYYTGEITEEDFEQFIHKSKELTNLINNNLNKTALLIKNFKQVSVDQVSENKREINIKEYINELIINVRSLTNNEKEINFDIDCKKVLNLNLYTASLSQIFTHLILNSIYHAYKDSQKGDIFIKIEKKKDRLEIQFKDYGSGIANENLSRIFEPFFTTQRINGRTGLGLNIVYNLVHVKFKGQISCESELDKGTNFKISLTI